MKTSPRFKKGQKIFRITSVKYIESGDRATQYFTIREHIVDGCGLNRLTVSDDVSGQYRNSWKPNATFGFTRLGALMFHATREDAVAAFEDYKKEADGTENSPNNPTIFYFFEWAEGCEPS